MKKTLLILLLFSSFLINAQAESYYNDVDLTKSELELKDELAVKTAAAHTNFLSYTPGIWEASKITDVDPTNEDNVLLIYGYNDTDGDYITDRTRSKSLNGGNTGTDWNREHTYANSLANPKLEKTGKSGPPYAEAFNLRPSDVKMNSNRGNTKFADGSGNAGNQNGGWYPGDEWKGDVARMMMYMYIRYGDQCKPTGVGIGNLVGPDDEMIDLFLEWNVEDPVSDFERQRNAYHDSNAAYAQGNRNPFIDNAYLATRIWGGENALDSWGIYLTPDTEAPTVPTSVTLNNITSTSINASWTASTDNEAVTKYEVYANGVLQGNTANTTYSLTSLTTGTAYSITILAKDIANNKSAQSIAANATTLTDITPPTVPTGITITNQSGSSFKVSWSASTDDSSVESYAVYVDGALNGTSTNTTYTAIGLAPNTTYSVTISAKDIANNVSAKSTEVSATTTVASSTCATETFDKVPDKGSSYSTFTWTGDNGIDWTAVKSRSDKEATLNGKAVAIDVRDSKIGSLTSSTFANGIGSLTASTLRAFSGGTGNLDVFVNGVKKGTLPYGDEIQTTTISNINIYGNIIVSISESTSGGDRVIIDDLSWTCYSTLSTEEDIFNSFKMYPNPTDGNTVYFKITESAEVKMYNVLGKLIKKATLNQKNNSVDTSNLTKGIYLVKINFDNQSITKKLIKN
ncbi:endonuclease [Polaribacter sp. 11A2H]|uniref:endonuclease n=1 Tax=Polaribacter sp. 11A2H TaxID=2687290 RepID=UPI0014084563|nr:endonuclease [Polaribacter sp. 11A2H]